MVDSFFGIDSWQELLILVLGLIFAVGAGIVLTFLNRYLQAKANISIFENEEQMRSQLSTAIFNGLHTVVKNNDYSTVLNEQDGSHIKAIKQYVVKTSPEVLTKLKVDVSSDTLDQVIAAKVTQILADKAV